MNKEQHIETQRIVALLAQAVHGTAPKKALFDGITDAEWEQLLELASHHNVGALAADGIQALPPENKPSYDIWLKWVALGHTVELQSSNSAKTLANMLAAFNKENIDTMVLKGFSLSAHYPIPFHRSFGDIDIYQFGKYKKGDALVRKQFNATVSNKVHHHTKYSIQGILVENHYDFVSRHGQPSNRRFEKLLKKQVKQGARQVTFAYEKAFLPSATFNALFLMRHMAAHFAADRISLRHLCDWLLFVEREYAQVDWEMVWQQYRKFNMNLFAGAINGILVSLFGADPKKFPTDKTDTALLERVLNEIMYGEFTEPCPTKGTCKIVKWKKRRFKANRWKHEICYSDSYCRTFFASAGGHLLKPYTITH